MTLQIVSSSSEASLAETVAALFPQQPQDPTRAACSIDGARSARRRKLWEIGASYHCAVIGTCLPMPELRRLARHSGIEEWNSASDFGLHHAAVSYAGERNALSGLMQKELERRFAHAVRRFAPARTDADLQVLWQQSLSRGEVGGAIWALMTHPSASEDLLRTASEELHMLSHQTGASSRADLQRLAQLEAENESLRGELEQHRARSARHLAQKDTRIAVLEQRVAALAGAEHRARDAEKRIHVLENERVRRQPLLVDESLRARQAYERTEALARAEARCRELEQELAKMKRECEGAERMLQSLLDQIAERTCPSARSTGGVDLEGRCVLYVGGRTGMIEHCRVLVEHCRGRFTHHDGGQENNFRRLHALLASADAVICAASHINHGAYYLVKRFCKHDRKRCVLLRNASLSSFANAIRALCGERLAGSAADTLIGAGGA